MGKKRAERVTCHAEGEDDKEERSQDEDGRGRVARREGVGLIDV